MDVKENDVHRSARDIGHSVIDAVQVKLSNAVNAGAINLGPEQLAAVLELVKTTGTGAIENATVVYVRAFDAHKKSALPK